MPTYPRILVPRKLEAIQLSEPDLPPKPKMRAMPPKPKEPKPPKKPPNKPSLPEQPQGRFRKTGWLLGTGLVATSLLTGSGELLVAGGLALYGVYDATFGYEQRLQEYEERKRHYETFELPEWQQAFKRWEEEKECLVEQWRLECIKIEQEWKAEKDRLLEEYTKKCEELLSPENVIRWRLERVKKAVVINLSESDARQGKLDHLLLDSLRTNLPQLDIYWQQGLIRSSSTSNKPYTPDVIVHDPVTNIWVDVEIDEPWFLDKGSKTPIHCDGRDGFRNDFFLENCWIVIRFAESQVAQYPLSCVKCVAEVLDRFRSQGRLVSNLKFIPDIPLVPTWTIETALTISREF